MQTLQLDEFLRSIKQNIDTPHSLLLGAGASIESGIPSAADCIWDWKREIYLSKNPGAIGNFDNSKSEGVRRVIQRWIDAQNIYPAENSADEYSYFAEKAYPIADDRRKYFQHLVANHNPSLGYHLISLLALENIIKSVWTTNFDKLIENAASKLYNTTDELTVSTLDSNNIARDAINNEKWPLLIKLHGDFQSKKIKNTNSELEKQDTEYRKLLIEQCQRYGLIVAGYSGRDESIMSSFREALENGNAFPHGLLWLMRAGEEPCSKLKNLIFILFPHL